MSKRAYEHVEMEPAAADFIELLRDLGHVDDAAVERLTNELMNAGSATRPVTLDDVRRHAAVFLFEAQPGMRPDQRDLLGAEWDRLFG